MAIASCILGNSYSYSRTLPRLSWVLVGSLVSSASYDRDVMLIVMGFIRLLIQGLVRVSDSVLIVAVPYRVLWSVYQCTGALNGPGQELRPVHHGNMDGRIGLQDTGREE